MRHIAKAFAIIAATGMMTAPAMAADAQPDGADIFSKKCTMCHKIDTKKMGPAVKSMNPDTETLRSVIADGRGMMPKYSKKLSAAEIDAVVAYIQAEQGK